MGFVIEEMDEANLRRIARIMGEHSAATKALNEAKERRARGEDPVIGLAKDGTLVVVSRKHTSPCPEISPELALVDERKPLR